MNVYSARPEPQVTVVRLRRRRAETKVDTRRQGEGRERISNSPRDETGDDELRKKERGGTTTPSDCGSLGLQAAAARRRPRTRLTCVGEFRHCCAGAAAPEVCACIKAVREERCLMTPPQREEKRRGKQKSIEGAAAATLLSPRPQRPVRKATRRKATEMQLRQSPSTSTMWPQHTPRRLAEAPPRYHHRRETLHSKGNSNSSNNSGSPLGIRNNGMAASTDRCCQHRQQLPLRSSMPPPPLVRTATTLRPHRQVYPGITRRSHHRVP